MDNSWVKLICIEHLQSQGTNLHEIFSYHPFVTVSKVVQHEILIAYTYPSQFTIYICNNQTICLLSLINWTVSLSDWISTMISSPGCCTRLIGSDWACNQRWLMLDSSGSPRSQSDCWLPDLYPLVSPDCGLSVNIFPHSHELITAFCGKYH